MGFSVIRVWQCSARMWLLFAGLGCLAFVGCSSVEIDAVVGEPVSTEALSKFEGQWEIMGESKKTLVEFQLNKSRQLVGKSELENAEPSTIIDVRQLGENTFWFCKEKGSSYTVLWITMKDSDHFQMTIPNPDRVKLAIEQGKLDGRVVSKGKNDQFTVILDSKSKKNLKAMQASRSLFAGEDAVVTEFKRVKRSVR